MLPKELKLGPTDEAIQYMTQTPRPDKIEYDDEYKKDIYIDTSKSNDKPKPSV